MTSPLDYIDPLSDCSETTQSARASAWWGRAANKTGRDPKQELTPRSKLRALLEAGEWDETSGSARSLDAWRGLWVTPRWGLLRQALETNLAPPAREALPDWWSKRHFRNQACRSLFLPGYPAPKPGAPVAHHDAYRGSEADRHAVAHALLERWPKLLDAFMRAAEAETSPYRHPLACVARPGAEADFDRLCAWDGVSPLLRSREPGPGWDGGPLLPRFTPVELLALGLRRRFAPLIGESLAAGASVDDSFRAFDDKRHTLLHGAIKSADTPVVDWVLEKNPNLEALDWRARTPWLCAARQSDVETLQKLRKCGANLHAVDRFGQNAAHLVIEGLSHERFDREAFSQTGERRYVRKSDFEMETDLRRAAQALVALQMMGVDLSAPALAAPKKSKTAPSPYAELPRAARTAASAKEGETWAQQMERRCDADRAFGVSGLAWVRSVKLDTQLMATLPPLPSDEELEPAGVGPVPRPTRRPRF